MDFLVYCWSKEKHARSSFGVERCPDMQSIESVRSEKMNVHFYNV